MFTGIIEETGKVVALKKDKSNLHISIINSFLKEIKVDQSIAHNGVCLTVVKKTHPRPFPKGRVINKRKSEEGYYTVTAINETLKKSNLGALKIGDEINLERCMKASGRFDGHIVQGHVDCTATVHSIVENNGSWIFRFKVSSPKPQASSPKKQDSNSQVENLLVEKGSVCVNGVSLTVVDVYRRQKTEDKIQKIKEEVNDKSVYFSVAIIPYTFEHTNFHSFKKGDLVNIEFDIVGKYISKILQNRF